MMKKGYSYCIIFLLISALFPVTPRLFFRLISNLSQTTSQTEQCDKTTSLYSVEGTTKTIIIDPEMSYIGDNKGVGLEYYKEFTLESVGSKNTLSLRVAGMVAVRNDNESEDYHNGFYTNKLYVNGNYVDNLNNYIYQEEDRTFRTIMIPLPSHVLRPGHNKLIVIAKGPKGGNHDDFALKEIKLLQR
jgi:hypothetical protein